MNKIYKQDASNKAFYISSSQNGGSSFNSEKKKKKKKKNERIVELKKTKCKYCHEKGHWAKECEKKKEDKKEESFANLVETSSFANLVETFGFVKSAGYAISTSHGPTHQSNIHDWIADANASEHMTNQRDWFSSLKMIEPNTWGVDLANNQKLWAHGVGIIHVNYLVSGKWHKHVLEGVLYVSFLKIFFFSIG
jgi:hypothetical protein